MSREYGCLECSVKKTENLPFWNFKSQVVQTEHPRHMVYGMKMSGDDIGMSTD